MNPKVPRMSGLFLQEALVFSQKGGDLSACAGSS